MTGTVKLRKARVSSPPGSLPVAITIMPLYDATHRLSADACAVRLRDGGNHAINAYTFSSFRDHPAFSARAWVHERNLHRWNGFGIDPAAVDVDSEVKHAREATRPGGRQQLPPGRVFHAVPDLSQPGAAFVGADPNGIDTSGVRCEPLAERDFARFDPGVAPVDVAHVVPQWRPTASRDASRVAGAGTSGCARASAGR
jgi:hypothetical protein